MPRRLAAVTGTRSWLGGGVTVSSFTPPSSRTIVTSEVSVLETILDVKFVGTGWPSLMAPCVLKEPSPSTDSTFMTPPARARAEIAYSRSEEHTSELQSLRHLVCRLLLE